MRQQTNGTELRSQENEPLAVLGYPVLFAVHDIDVDVIFGVLEGPEKLLEDALILKSWNVFHRDEFGRYFLDEPRELQEKPPPFVVRGRLLIVGGKCLTGSASGQQTDTVFRKYPFEVFRLEVFDGF
jgi:hypothetical protein